MVETVFFYDAEKLPFVLFFVESQIKKNSRPAEVPVNLHLLWRQAFDGKFPIFPNFGVRIVEHQLYQQLYFFMAENLVAFEHCSFDLFPDV